MTSIQLASRIAKVEGKKSQARIGDIREILGILADLIQLEPNLDTIGLLINMGIKRAARKPKKKRTR